MTGRRSRAPTGRGRVDTRSLGLDLGTGLMRFLTGREILHYGLWENGLEVCAANLRIAQEAYTERLFRMLPPGELTILDIGGGTGETASDLLGLGHDVEIVVPSKVLAERCLANAGPNAKVHCVPFEGFGSDRRFDICLFSESFQYIAVDAALDNAAAHLADGGEILIADCFRSEAFGRDFTEHGLVGGGHDLAAFRRELKSRMLEIAFEDDITELVAPSVELEQQFFNMIGNAALRIDRDLRVAFPRLRWLAAATLRRLLGARRRMRLERRLLGDHRNAEAFCRYNRYLMLKIRPMPADSGRLGPED